MTPSQEKYRQRRLAFAEFIKLYPFTIDDLDGEEWRPIEGYEGYQISNFGRVKSFKRNSVKILRPKLGSSNYLITQLNKNDKTQWHSVHRLVAEAFIPNPDNKPQVNHIDGCKMNACTVNLEWVTHSENMRHAYDTGLCRAGEGNGRAKLTNEQALYIRENPDNLMGITLAEKFGVNATVISHIQRGLKYKNVGGQVREARRHSPRVPDELRAQIHAEYVKRDKKFGANALARKYGVAMPTIVDIVKQVRKARGEVIPKGKSYPRVPDEIRAQIRAEYVRRDKEFGAPALAKKYGIGKSTVLNIVNEK